jgi:hypothetical protein
LEDGQAGEEEAFVLDVLVRRMFGEEVRV